VVGREARIDIDIADRMLWQRSRITDAPEDECARYLDLASFADGRLDADDGERVADRLRRDPEVAADIAAARTLASIAQYEPPSETLVAPLCAIVEGAAESRPSSVLVFRPREGRRPVLGSVAQWSSLAAALVVAGWLGFTLGMDASGMLAPSRAGSDDGIAQDLFGPSRGFFRDLTGGA
jgi:anti-sigma factor RsiW